MHTIIFHSKLPNQYFLHIFYNFTQNSDSQMTYNSDVYFHEKVNFEDEVCFSGDFVK